MEEYIISAMTSQFNVLNVSDIVENTTKETGLEQDDNERNKEIGRLVQVIGRPILVVFGTVGNLLSFYIMTKGSLNRLSTCFYMAILGLADTGVLWSGCLLWWVGHLTRFTVNPETWTDCKVAYFIYFTMSHYSSALLVVMSVEKCFALYFPLKTKRICTVCSAKRVSFVSFVIFGLFNFQFFFVIKAQTGSNGFKVCVFLPESYQLMYYRVEAIIYFFVLFTIMILANLAIVFKFMVAKWKNRTGSSTESTSQALSKSATKGTAMLITVSITYLILTGPVRFVYALTDEPHPIVDSVILLLLYSNNSINGVLYCITGSKFRNELMDVLCCRKKKGLEASFSSYRDTSAFTISRSLKLNQAESSTASI